METNESTEPGTVMLTLRMPRGIHDRVRLAAYLWDTSRNKAIIRALDEALPPPEATS